MAALQLVRPSEVHRHDQSASWLAIVTQSECSPLFCTASLTDFAYAPQLSFPRERSFEEVTPALAGVLEHAYSGMTIDMSSVRAAHINIKCAKMLEWLTKVSICGCHASNQGPFHCPFDLHNPSLSLSNITQKSLFAYATSLR